MFNKKNHYIYTIIYIKYDNDVMPEISRMIVSYLLQNQDKVEYYISNKIHVGMILEHLSNKFRENHELDVQNEIINYVEGEIWQII